MVSAPTGLSLDLVFHRWTWYSNAGGVAKETDHVLVDGRWKMIQNSRVNRSAQFLNTDHRLVVATLKLQLKSRRMVPAQPRLGDPEELWSAFKTTVLDVAGGCLGTHWRAKNNFAQGTLDTIDQSRRSRLNGRAELFRELRRKSCLQRNLHVVFLQARPSEYCS